MTVNDILLKANQIADSKTFYVRGCDGIAMNQAAKLKYSSNDPFNIKRTKQIFALSDDTLGFDEFSFFNYVTGYDCKNFGDVLSKCHDISKNFDTIIPGEAVFMGDRFGIFIGGNRVIAISPVGVGYTILNGWVSHARINGVDYEEIKDDNETEVERDSEGSEAETSEEDTQLETDMEVRPSGTGSGDRVQQVPSQAKGYDRGHGRRRP